MQGVWVDPSAAVNVAVSKCQYIVLVPGNRWELGGERRERKRENIHDPVLGLVVDIDRPDAELLKISVLGVVVDLVVERGCHGC